MKTESGKWYHVFMVARNSAGELRHWCESFEGTTATWRVGGTARVSFEGGDELNSLLQAYPFADVEEVAGE